MFGDDDVVLPVRREHPTGVEAQAERGDVRPYLEVGWNVIGAVRVLTIDGVPRVALVAERVAEILPSRGRVIELVGGRILPEPVAAVIAEPELPGHRTERHADAVAHALSVDFEQMLLMLNPQDGCLDIGWHREIGGRALVEIKPAVRPHHQELPVVPILMRQPLHGDLWRRRIVQVVLDMVVAEDSLPFGDKQRAVGEGDTIWRIHPFEEFLDLAVAALIDDGIDRVVGPLAVPLAPTAMDRASCKSPAHNSILK